MDDSFSKHSIACQSKYRWVKPNWELKNQKKGWENSYSILKIFYLRSKRKSKYFIFTFHLNQAHHHDDDDQDNVHDDDDFKK